MRWGGPRTQVRQVLEVEAAVNALLPTAGGVLVGDARGDVGLADPRAPPSGSLSWRLGGGGVVGLADAALSGVVAAVADGDLVLLDARKGGVELARVVTGGGARLTCLSSAGSGAVAVGDSSGVVSLWRTRERAVRSRVRASAHGVRSLSACAGLSVGGGHGVALISGDSGGRVSVVF